MSDYPSHQLPRIDQSIGDFFAAVAEELGDSPEKLWIIWLNTNRRRLPEAIAELGLPPVPEGENFYNRIREVVLPALVNDKLLKETSHELPPDYD